MTWAYYSVPALFRKFSEYEEPGVSGSESESADSEHEQDTTSGLLHFHYWHLKLIVFAYSFYDYSNWS